MLREYGSDIKRRKSSTQQNAPEYLIDPDTYNDPNAISYIHMLIEWLNIEVQPALI